MTDTTDAWAHLLACYRSGQISARQWAAYLADPEFSAWVTGQNLERATVAAEADRVLTADDVRDRLRQACAAAGTPAAWARQNNMTRAYVSLTLRGGFPGTKITDALGLKKNVTWALDVGAKDG